MKKEYYIQVCRYLLIVLWIYAAGSKLWSYSAFKIQLSRQPLPGWSAPILQWLLPLTELVAVALLCFQRSIRAGFSLSSVLMTSFTIYVGLGLLHVYNKVPCVCGGILGKMGWSDHFIFNSFFLLLSLIGMLLPKNSFMSLRRTYSAIPPEKI